MTTCTAAYAPSSTVMVNDVADTRVVGTASAWTTLLYRVMMIRDALVKWPAEWQRFSLPGSPASDDMLWLCEAALIGALLLAAPLAEQNGELSVVRATTTSGKVTYLAKQESHERHEFNNSVKKDSERRIMQASARNNCGRFIPPPSPSRSSAASDDFEVVNLNLHPPTTGAPPLL